MDGSLPFQWVASSKHLRLSDFHIPVLDFGIHAEMTMQDAAHGKHAQAVTITRTASNPKLAAWMQAFISKASALT